MMYVRRRTVIEVSEDAEFAAIKHKWESQITPPTPGAWWEFAVDSAPGGIPLDLDEFFATVLEATIHNNGANLVTVTWTGNAGAQSQRIAAGEQGTITDVNVGVKMVLTGVASQCRVMILGT